MHVTAEFIRGVLVILFVGGACLWLIVWTVKKAEDPALMAFKWVITAGVLSVMVLVAAPMVGQGGYSGAFGGIPLAAVCGLALAITWRRNIAELVANPIASLYDGGSAPPEPKPAYSVAQARQKQGRYHEAIAEVRKQLSLFPTDFEGHMLLAQIQAENTKDMAAAGATIEALCAQPGHAPINIAFALYSLADWHLQINKDREAARCALEQVTVLLPDTEYALTAAQRVAHLADPDKPLSERDRKVFLVPEGVKNIGLAKNMKPVAPPEKTPAELAQEYVMQLVRHPLDNDARERLAVLYADHYGRLDLAADQLEQIINHPNQPARVVVRCLNLLADFQIRHGADYETVKATLERIIDRDPDLAAAENARNRLALLKLELKGKEKGQTVKMGTYEQNIGLKRVRRPPLESSSG
jgi:tetratricopeptide (TPR) repeat protein